MTDPIAPSSLLTPLISSAAMRAVLDDRARLQRMLDFIVTLARAEAAIGIVPALASDQIANAAKAERYDVKALGEEAVVAGNVAIPLIKALSTEVAKADAAAAGWVNWGASSQDVIDTALVLDLRAAVDALIIDLNHAIEGFTTLAGRHRRTAAVGRTWLQHALPMPFGLKLAGYAAALARSRERLRRLRKEALVLQFGGAVGTLATLNDKGLDVAERLAALLDLSLPEAPWHSHHDRLAEVASALAILTGSCGKIARDVGLLMQTDVAEAFEPAAPGRGISSTLPHKRNPTAAAWRWQRRRSLPTYSPPSWRRRCRSTSAHSAAGRRSGRRFRRWRWSPRAPSTPSSRSPRASRSTASACASISAKRAG